MKPGRRSRASSRRRSPPCERSRSGSRLGPPWWRDTRSGNTRLSSPRACWISLRPCASFRDEPSSWQPRTGKEGCRVHIPGRHDPLEGIEEPMRAAGARRVVRLPVSGAFHSPLMATVAEGLAEAFEAETWREAWVPIMSNVTAEPLTDPERIRPLLAEQVRSPVEWVGCVERMAADGVDTMIECGAGSALVGMVRRIAPAVRTATVSDFATLAGTADLLAAPA